jgi:hypothetical protein
VALQAALEQAMWEQATLEQTPSDSEDLHDVLLPSPKLPT